MIGHVAKYDLWEEIKCNFQYTRNISIAIITVVHIPKNTQPLLKSNANHALKQFTKQIINSQNYKMSDFKNTF